MHLFCTEVQLFKNSCEVWMFVHPSRRNSNRLCTHTCSIKCLRFLYCRYHSQTHDNEIERQTPRCKCKSQQKPIRSGEATPAVVITDTNTVVMLRIYYICTTEAMLRLCSSQQHMRSTHKQLPVGSPRTDEKKPLCPPNTPLQSVWHVRCGSDLTRPHCFARITCDILTRARDVDPITSQHFIANIRAACTCVIFVSSIHTSH